MKIATRLNLLSLAVILVMTAAVLAATLFFIEASERQSYERLMQLELQTATQAIRQQLNRSGVVAASKEAAAQLERLRQHEGFASASLFIVEKNDNRVVYHPRYAMGDRAEYDFVDEMIRRGTGSLEYEYQGDPRMSVFHTLRPIDWLVGVAVSRNEIHSAMFRLMRSIGGITFAALFLNAIAVSLFGRWLTRRLLVLYRNRAEARVDENVNEAEVEYWLGRRVLLEGVAGDRGILGADLLWTRRW